MSYEVNPISIVGSIRNDLMGVTGFSLVKEFIQNADDAQARRFAIGWAPGILGARHPLLADPAVFIVNDGPFSSEDAKAIRQLNLSGKASHKGTIGKFGLGMKSVFSLGEAFFYLADGQQLYDPRYPGAAVMSPWIVPAGQEHQDGARPEWRDFDVRDQHFIRQSLRERGVFDGFALWVPLRKKAHCQYQDKEISIFKRRYDDGKLDDVFDPELEDWLAGLWPMLRSLRHVEIHREVGVSTLTMPKDAKTRAFPDHNGNLPREQRQLYGEICGTGRWRFAGVEGNLPSLQSFRQLDNWPTLMKSGLASDEVVPDKSLPHHAAVFELHPKSSGQKVQLSVLWSVFLPVGKPSETIPLADTHSITLNLHGYFFLQSDRKSILAWQEIDVALRTAELRDESDVTGLWNARLARQGTLGDILPALEVFERTVGERAIIRNLVEAITRTNLFRDFRANICHTHQWVRRQLEATSDWKLEMSSSRVLSIPNGRIAFEVLPNLAMLSRSEVIVFEDDPYLTLCAPLSCWPTELTDQVLEDIDVASVFGNEKRLAYLNRFLARQDEGVNLRLNSRLVRLFKQALRLLSHQDLETLNHELSKFLSFISVDAQLELPESIAADLKQQLLDLDLAFVLVPHPLKGAEQQTVKISTSEGLKILKRLEGQSTSSGFIQTVLTRSQDKTGFLEHVRMLKLFRVDNPAAGQREQMVAREDLRNQNAKRLLFDNNQNQYTFAREMQDILLESQVWLIDKGLAEIIDLKVGQCDKPACITLLELKPSLNHLIEKRLALIDKLKTPHPRPAPAERSAVRYLLHSEADHFEMEGPLFYPVTGQPQWSGIVEKLLTPSPEAWRWLGIEFADMAQRYTQNFMNGYGLVTPDHESVAALLGTVASRIDLSRLSDEEHDFLLEELRDQTLLRRLPIHETLGGERVAAPDGAYLEGAVQKEWQGSPELISDLRFIRKHPRLHYKQEQMGLKELQPYDVVKHALGKEDPSRFWPDIVAMILIIPATAVSDALRQIPWLPRRGTGPVAPINVIHLPDLMAEVAQLNSGILGRIIVSDELPAEVLEHPAFANVITKVLPTRAKAITMLGAVMAESENYLIGELPSETISDWQFAFKNADQFMPAAPILVRLGEDAEPLWNAVAKPIKLARPEIALTLLRDRHQTEIAKESKATIKRVYDNYLCLAVGHNGWDLAGAGVELLNRVGDWRTPGELCAGQEGVDLAFLLDKEQAKILDVRTEVEVIEGQAMSAAEVLPKTRDDWANIDGLVRDSVNKLKQYFLAWRPHVREELIGAFLSVLGDDPEMARLAQSYLGGSFTVEKVRAGFDIEGYDKYTLPEKIRSYRFLIEIVNSEAFTVTNLLGKPLTVHATANPEHLFAGQIKYQRHEGVFYAGAKILKIPPARDDAQLDRILCESVQKLFANAYSHTQTNLEGMWSKLAESEQINLAVAQRLIVDSAFSYIKSQLGVKSGPLAEVFKAWDDARFGLAQEQILGGASEKTSKVHEEEAKARLGRFLAEDKEVQSDILEALRNKLNGYQYHVSSIPFEIFQNADDALEELKCLGGEPQQYTFRLVAGHEGLSFMHWGRMINYSPRGRKEDYHRDLEKMLTLNASDKGVEVTGKFGLGFKSVFLVTDRPQVVSGDLGFEVMGGVYPVKLTPEAFGRLRGHLTSALSTDQISMRSIA